MNFDLSIYDATVIPAIIFVIWVIIQIGLPKKFAPVVALVIGVAAGLALEGLSVEGLIVGVLLGAASVGFYSGTKNTIEGGTKGNGQFY
ncbi:hypothetical protein P9B03_08570 [Metasolibacillus meyeri]|uniref:Holin n=1 Tax=Metasolibacillus meyeri TaxID=1071052 RepID=A0AAW9NLM2_9BACL|nr:hypothetical protein [Metasolibacillus meyeri]MEC1178532.1 hypothetical protein [Metasolibacillus meyeri]